jgi:hypothetical protein
MTTEYSNNSPKMSGFQLYRKSVDDAIREALGPGAKQSKLVVEAANRWKSLMPDVKAEWEELASAAAPVGGAAAAQTSELDGFAWMAHLGHAGTQYETAANDAGGDVGGEAAPKGAADADASTDTGEAPAAGGEAGAACALVRPTPAFTLALPAVAALEAALLGAGAGTTPIPYRMRAIYYLRTIGTAECIAILCRALVHTTGHAPVHSPLLRHEIGFVLGQLREASACPTLETVLQDAQEDVMVRHECT